MKTADNSYRLKPVERQTLAQAVMQRLMDYIVDGGLQPGDPLPSQYQLAEQLGVSRPVLREAMQGLASVGVLEIRPGSGCYVGSSSRATDPAALFEILTHEAALQALEARMVVEVELAGLAAARATESDYADVEAILERLRQALDRGGETAAITSEFHRTLAVSGHNTFLHQMSQLLDQARTAQFSRIEAALPDVKSDEYESHRELLEAIRSGDPALARAAMQRHLEEAHGMEERVSWLKVHNENALAGASASS
ncbi:MAG: FadR/GntR family transcriptional regulator [Thermomicrobiales bacterium]